MSLNLFRNRKENFVKEEKNRVKSGLKTINKIKVIKKKPILVNSKKLIKSEFEIIE